MGIRHNKKARHLPVIWAARAWQERLDRLDHAKQYQ